MFSPEMLTLTRESISWNAAFGLVQMRGLCYEGQSKRIDHVAESEMSTGLAYRVDRS